MRKIFFTAVFVLTLTFAGTCAAADVWLSSYDGTDCYVAIDTLRGNSDGHFFSVKTKDVRNGQLQKVVEWKYSKFKTDMWRYETSTMDASHTTVVIPRNELFEFCMNRLGWSYRTDGNYYY